MIKLWFNRFSQAWTSCMLAMVGGNMTVLSWYHAGVAAKVGVAGATALVITATLLKTENKWADTWLTGIFVMLADLMFVTQHTKYYGEGVWLEAALTGLGAAILCFLLEGKKDDTRVAR